MNSAIRTAGLRKVYPPTGKLRRAGAAERDGRLPPVTAEGRALRPSLPIVALDALDLDIREGEFFGLLGPNGAGKTTTLGILTTRVRATSGNATVAGTDVVTQPSLVRQRIGVVPQRPNPDRALNVRENLIFHAAYFGLARTDAERRASDLLERLDIAEKAEAKVDDLSGGQQQRLRKELPFFLVRVALQPLLVTIVFGYLLPKMGFIGRGSPSTGGVHYSTALLPGILAISITLSSIQSVALPMVQDFGWTLEIEDRLLAPVSNALVTVLGATAFSALGLLLGAAINPQQIGLMFSVIIAPMIMFGCAYYPWKGLETVPVLKWVVLINPLVYVAEGLRAALTPSVAHMRLDVVLAALIVLATLFWILGLRSFHRRAIG